MDKIYKYPFLSYLQNLNLRDDKKQKLFSTPSMPLSREGSFTMKILQISLIYLLCLFFILACSTGEADPLEVDELEENELQTIEEDPTQSIDYSQMDVEELKKQATVYTFEDIKSMTPKQISDVRSYLEDIIIFWFKDFKQWDFSKLNDEQIEELLRLFHYHNGDFEEDGLYYHVYIDNDKMIHNLTLEQFKTAVDTIYTARLPELIPIEELGDLRKYVSENRKVKPPKRELCFGSYFDRHLFGTNYYPVEYMQQLSGDQLYMFKDCLRADQLIALNNDQIIESENFRADDDSVPFSPEKLKSLGSGLKKMSCEEFRKLNQDQVSGLTPPQIGFARGGHFSFFEEWRIFEWCWLPKQMTWMSPEQIGGLIIDERTMIHRDHIEVLNDDQLRGFSLDQTSKIQRDIISVFSPHHLRVFKENGTASEFMERAIYYQDLGEDLFLQYPYSVNSDIPHFELVHYLTSLLPIQFKSIRRIQARKLPFSIPLKLSPEHIASFPHLTAILNFSERQLDWERYEVQYKEETEGWRSGYDYLQIVYEREKNLLDTYDTLNHLELLSREQAQAIPPEQIQKFPPQAVRTLYKRNFNQEENDEFYEEGTIRREFVPIYKKGLDKYDLEENKKFKEDANYEAPYEVPLTVDQFAALTLEQFKAIFGKKITWQKEASYLTDEYFNTLSLEKIDFLMEYIDPSSIYFTTEQKRVLDRKRELDSAAQISAAP